MKQKLYILFRNIFLKIKYLSYCVRLFFIRSNVKSTKNNWHLSKNSNFYNPTLEATVYKYGSIWKIARYNNFFGEFYTKEEAMESIHQKWIEENNINETINVLENSLKKIQQNESTIYDEENKTLHISEEYKDQEEHKNYRIVENIENDFNFMAEYFYLLQTNRECYKCRKDILVNAILLPEGFETIDEYAIEDLEKEGIDLKGALPFCSNDYLSLLSYVTYISPRALEEIHKYVNKELFKNKHSLSVNYSYYRSICSYCGAAQGDNFIITEYNSAFHPINIEDFKKIKFHKIDEAIQVRAGGNSVGYDYVENSLVSVRNIYNIK